jgi:plastocyanin
VFRVAPALAALTVFASTAALPSNSRAQTRPATGRIEGAVVISSALAARRPAFRIYNEPGTGGIPPAPPRDARGTEVRNVVVYLEGDTTVLPASPDRMQRARHGTMAQRDERFVPHVLPVLVGATVDFPNDDEFYHNVFSLSTPAGPNGFDLGRYPRGSSKSWTFGRPGNVQVFCHIHQDMSASVLVLSNPYFASPGGDRHYVIDDVPEGDYTIVGWHDRASPVVKRVHVTAGQTSTIDFNIPVPPSGNGR